MYLALLLTGLTTPMGVQEWVGLLIVRERWFIKAYIVLYVFAPVLNAFVEKADKTKMQWFLIGFFTIQTLHGFINDSSWFSCGYSPLSLMGIYMLARYMRLYPNRWTNLNKYADMTVYLGITLLNVILCLISISMGHGTWRLFAYSSPLVILQTAFFFLFFTKLHFKSRMVNWVAISSFAAYLLHTNIRFFNPYYVKTIRTWSETESTMTFLLYTSVWIAGLFILAIIIDKLRIALWGLSLKWVDFLSNTRKQKLHT